MKKYKLFAALLAIGSGLGLASCGNSTNPSDSTEINPSDSIANENAKTDDSFVVNVKYPDGKPVKDAKVQWCSVSNGTCYSMVSVDDNGQAFTNELKDIKGEFTVHLQNLPAGYGYNPYALLQSHENHVNDITIIKLNNESRIEAPEDGKPVEITNGLGYYNAKIGKGENLYIYLTFSEAGTYLFESYNPSPSDLMIGYCGNDVNKPTDPNKYDDNSGNENNFKFSFEVSDTSKQYLFLIREKESTSTFTFSILKK